MESVGKVMGKEKNKIKEADQDVLEGKIGDKKEEGISVMNMEEATKKNEVEDVIEMLEKKDRNGKGEGIKTSKSGK